MPNPIKAIKLAWYMRRVPGGYRRGDPDLVVEAFIRAGIFKESEREGAQQVLVNDRIADACDRLADKLGR